MSNSVDTKQHWDGVYAVRALDQMSWHRAHLETSIALIKRAARDRSAAIIDVGGGGSTLADDLIGLGYRNITVLDISWAALEMAKKRLGDASGWVRWLNADVSQPVFSATRGATEPGAAGRVEVPVSARPAPLSERTYDVWHDRAVFHFLTEPEERRAYVRNVVSAVKAGGHVIMATFGPEGPRTCSGLAVMRYDAASLCDELGARFRWIESFTELHRTPAGTAQQFLYCRWALKD